MSLLPMAAFTLLLHKAGSGCCFKSMFLCIATMLLPGSGTMVLRFLRLCSQCCCFLLAGSNRPDLVRIVASALVDLWARHARSPRLATPILRTAEVLLSQTRILSSPDDQMKLLGAAVTSIDLVEMASRCIWLEGLLLISNFGNKFGSSRMHASCGISLSC